MEICNIQKKYGKKTILQDISFSATEGQCIGILGGNGSGKSTLLSILAGVNRANGNGKFMFHNYNLLKNDKIRTQVVGYVPQSTPLLEELTAYDNLRLWYDKEDMAKELENGVLALLGIADFIKVPVNKMSGGMKKRLAIGCSVAHKPKILLLDEPTAALDLVCKEKIASYLKDFKASGGIILLATHDAQEFELCDSLYILKNGVLNSFEYDGNIHNLTSQL